MAHARCTLYDSRCRYTHAHNFGVAGLVGALSLTQASKIFRQAGCKCRLSHVSRLPNESSQRGAAAANAPGKPPGTESVRGCEYYWLNRIKSTRCNRSHTLHDAKVIHQMAACARSQISSRCSSSGLSGAARPPSTLPPALCMSTSRCSTGRPHTARESACSFTSGRDLATRTPHSAGQASCSC